MHKIEYDNFFTYYLEESLGVMFEHAHNNGWSLDEIWTNFLNSNVPHEIEVGNFHYLTCAGTDYLYEITQDKKWLTKELNIVCDQYYWLGYAIANYQQQTQCKFFYITKYITIQELFDSFYPLHEAPISKFIEFVDRLIKRRRTYTHLKELRQLNQLSQSQLAKKSEVSLRCIQMYEQKHLDINKAQVDSLYRLAQVLHCTIEDLLE